MSHTHAEGVGVHQHPHSHGHDHAHDHGPAGPDFRHTADGGPVVLDVGGDIGAIVLLTDPTMVGAELHISRSGEPDTGQHVAVHPRNLGGHVIHAAVYPDLPTGRYTLWALDGRPAMTVEVTGGAVTQARWPDSGQAVA
jgi:hypothetical protein